MTTVINLYAQIIIAVLGFIAPIVTILMPVLGDRISMIQKRIKEQETQLQAVKEKIESDYKEVINNAKHEVVKKGFEFTLQMYITSSTDTFDKSLSKLKRSLRHCNLKRQIKHIFIALLLSLVFVAVYYIIKLHQFTFLEFNENTRLLLRVIALSISGILFLYSLYRLWTLICVYLENSSDDTKDGEINPSTS